MGKGYNNFMCKKPFHPGSRENIKRVWMAEQRTEDEKKKQEELRIQYEKEQELYNNRLLVSTESKEKLSLNFMYEAPKGVKERVKEDDEPEYKFEWQRHAPRESFAKNNMDIRDQPFGIQVRNVRCIKCHKWGHLNTDRECPEFNQSVSLIPGGSKLNQDELLQAMHEDGLALKKTLNGEKFDPRELMVQKPEEDPEMIFLRSLSKQQKEKLLRKLNKLSGVATKSKKDSKKQQRRHENRSSDNSDESSDEHKKSRTHRHKHSKKHHKKDKVKRESRSRSNSPRKVFPKIGKVKSEPESDTEKHKGKEPSRSGAKSPRCRNSRSPPRSRNSRSPSYSPKRSQRKGSPIRKSIKTECDSDKDKRHKKDHWQRHRKSRSVSGSPSRSLSPRRKSPKRENNKSESDSDTDKRKDAESRIKSTDSYRRRSRSPSPNNNRRERNFERNYRRCSPSPKFERRGGHNKGRRSRSRSRSFERNRGKPSTFENDRRKGNFSRDDRRRDRY